MKLLSALLAASFLSGCTTAMYQGEYPLEKVAKITSEDTEIAKVDDVDVPYSGGNYAKILVLPGERKIDVNLNRHTSSSSTRSLESVPVYFIAEEGHEYLVIPQVFGSGKWRPVIMDKKGTKSVHYFK